MRIMISAITIVLFFAALAAGGNIYTWTDENGVKRFSDHPPEGVEDYETVKSRASAPESDEASRPGFEKMMQEVEQENRQDDQRKAAEAAQRKAQAQQKAQAEKDAKIQAERDRLQQQIDALNGRALSPTFTQGMRDNLIRQIQKQIDGLK